MRLAERFDLEIYPSLDEPCYLLRNGLDELFVRVHIHAEDVDVYRPHTAWIFDDFLILHARYTHLLQPDLMCSLHPVRVQMLLDPVSQFAVRFGRLDQLYGTNVRYTHTSHFRLVRGHVAFCQFRNCNFYGRLVHGYVSIPELVIWYFDFVYDVTATVPIVHVHIVIHEERR